MYNLSDLNYWVQQRNEKLWLKLKLEIADLH
jgi:hypothetical protein